MLKPIKTMLKLADVHRKENQAIALSDQESQIISGAGSKSGALWTDSFC